MKEWQKHQKGDPTDPPQSNWLRNPFDIPRWQYEQRKLGHVPLKHDETGCPLALMAWQRYPDLSRQMVPWELHRLRAISRGLLDPETFPAATMALDLAMTGQPDRLATVSQPPAFQSKSHTEGDYPVEP